MNSKSKWIWAKDNKIKNDWVIFKKDFEVDNLSEYHLEISADTRYFLWLNDDICTWDGGLFRDAYCENSGFIDKFDISKYLFQGKNTLKILVWHYGNGGRNNSPLEYAGVIFSCEELSLFSDESTLCQRHPSFGETEEPLPSYLYGGYNIGFDANLKLDEDSYTYATIYESELFGTLFERPVPMFSLSETVICDYEKSNDTYKVKLPTALHVMPYFKAAANGGEIINIRNDKYVSPGGPGGGGVGLYNGHRTQYTCKKGENEFLNFDYMPCEELHFTIPESVQIISLGYKISEYDTKIMPLFTCENENVNLLIEKCARTLKFCMRDNFMDCPDRERGQWIGDVSVQAPQVFYALDENAVPLLKKAILNFICLRKGKRLVGNVPGINFQELPSQSLNAISELGMIAKYYEFTNDKETLQMCLAPMVEYLTLWQMDKSGMVIRREGDWCWFDHLNNKDEVILENTWYYSALKFARRVCDILGENKHIPFLDERIKSIENNFEKLFWTGKCYASKDIVDDRANAMAVLVGLANPSNYVHIKNVLITTFNASTYMEGYIIEALFLMNYKQDGFNRMMNRYRPLIDNDSSTLWEDFAILGTKNHAWTGYPLNIIYKYIAGISVDINSKAISINPDFSLANSQKYTLNLAGGKLCVNLSMQNGQVKGDIKNTTKLTLITEDKNDN